ALLSLTFQMASKTNHCIGNDKSVWALSFFQKCNGFQSFFWEKFHHKNSWDYGGLSCFSDSLF
ncbi:hypothetical protein, partial [Novacetimonas hansenii]